MTVASVELCKALYADSGWADTTLNHFLFHNGNKTIEPKPVSSYLSAHGVPAYDLGYLLRKLPPSTAIRKRSIDDNHKVYSAFASVNRAVATLDSTPENAVTKLAIELFKQGVLREDVNAGG